MTFPKLCNPPRILLVLLLALLALPSLASAQRDGNSFGFDPGGIGAGVIIEDDFDDPASTEEAWGLDSAEQWSDHFTNDGSGGFALFFVDVDDNGGGQEGHPNSGASFPPPLQTGGGGFGENLGGPQPTFYNRGFFDFDFVIYNQPELERSPRVKIFGLEEPGLRIEVVYDTDAWSYRLVSHDYGTTHWVEIPSMATTNHVEIAFVSGGATQIGAFEVTWRATSQLGQVWTHTSRIQAPEFPEWSKFFLGMKTPDDELFVPPPYYHISWLYSFAYDNFGAYSVASAWKN